NQGVRPRVWFGERWITSVFDLFDENLRYYPSLLPILHPEDPDDEFAAGRAPQLAELRLHNGTGYRWNRPVYDLNENGNPHLRAENRVLWADPTVVAMMANAAFYFGQIRALATAGWPVWSQLTFDAAKHNFYAAAQRGIEATHHWPRVGEIAVTDLVLERL